MFLNICNYIRGREEDNNNYKQISIFKNVPLIFRLFFPAFVSVSTLVFCLLLVDVVALEFVVYFVGLLGGKFYKSLTNKNLDDFKDLAIISILLIVLNAFMVSIREFFAQLLSILWRKNITLVLHKLYFEKKNFYYIQQKLSSKNDVNSNNFDLLDKSTNVLIEPDLLNIKNNLDNPDQRITQDVNSLCKSFSTILPILIISPFVIGWYTYQAFLNIGYSGPLTVCVYFIVWSIINGPLTGPIARVIYKQDIKEGDFRFKHMNLRMNAESIAFYDSSQIELNDLNKMFEGLLNILYRRNWKELILNFFVNTSQYMGGIIAYLILGIPIFTHIYDDLKPADLAQFISNYSFKCQYLIYLFTRLFNTLDDYSNINGNVQRIAELYRTMNDETSSANAKKLNKMNEMSHEVCFIIEDLNLSVPNKSKILIKNLRLEFEQFKNILITGRSGCGKTSLFRAINGLWNYYTGKIILNSKSNDPKFMFFLPQKPYFTSGSLLEQIIYPSSYLEYSEEIESQVFNWLKEFNLEHLLVMVNSDINLKPSFNWQTTLSPGEQQRLSFLRVLFHRPKFILLDECTSSVDQETESLMYECLKENHVTYLSIAHRDTVRKYHQIELKILNDSNYKLLDLC